MEKKTVNSNCPEFGYELLSALPYAYNLYLKGELDSTISAHDTSCLYFFSPNHVESNCNRSWNNMNKLWKTNFPNIHIHKNQLDWDKFSPPPLKEYYTDKSISFEKETLVIFNRYNIEWGRAPINFLDIPTLTSLFDMLQNKYQIVYINIKGHPKYYDGVDALDLGDDDLLKKYPKVISINNLINDYPGLTYNEIQLRVFAKCEKYISSNGGQLILSAYFGGENVVFSKECRELTPEVNSFYRWYHKIGGSVLQHVNNYKDLLQLIKEKWVDNKPMINILVRTSGRPKYFEGCIESIYNQTYKNWNIIVGVDDSESQKYVQPTKSRMIKYNYSNVVNIEPPKNEEYGMYFKYNLYLNDLQNEVKYGYIIYLDDDDMLSDNSSLEKLTNNISNDDQFFIWRVQFPDRLVPSDNNFGKEPKLKDISGIGFAFNHKYKINWEPFKRGDYRVAKHLYNNIPKTIFINDVLTKLQREVEDGFGKRDDKTKKSDVINIVLDITKEKSPTERPIPIVSKLEKTPATINYDKVNQIFNGQTHVGKTRQQNNTGNERPTGNVQTIQKLMGKRRGR
jgi:hypothetical protein